MNLFHTFSNKNILNWIHFFCRAPCISYRLFPDSLMLAVDMISAFFCYFWCKVLFIQITDHFHVSHFFRYGRDYSMQETNPIQSNYPRNKDFIVVVLPSLLEYPPWSSSIIYCFERFLFRALFLSRKIMKLQLKYWRSNTNVMTIIVNKKMQRRVRGEITRFLMRMKILNFTRYCARLSKGKYWRSNTNVMTIIVNKKCSVVLGVKLLGF